MSNNNFYIQSEKNCYVGPNSRIDLSILSKEIDSLSDTTNVKISSLAWIILPQHIDFDRRYYENKRFGYNGLLGVLSCTLNSASYIGIRFGDLVFCEKEVLKNQVHYVNSFYPYFSDNYFNIDEIVNDLLKYRDKLAKYISLEK